MCGHRNIISIRKCIVYRDVVSDVTCTCQGVITCVVIRFLACLDEVQEELLYYPGVGFGVVSGSVSKKFHDKVFYVMGEALSGELSCPCDRSCLNIYISATIGQTPSILGT